MNRDHERPAAAAGHVPALAQYIRQHVLGRCGQAVSLLAEANLIAWPSEPESETEINEWWLVSDELAHRLRGASQPVLRFGELNMWGRASTGADLREDLALAGAILG